MSDRSFERLAALHCTVQQHYILQVLFKSTQATSCCYFCWYSTPQEVYNVVYYLLQLPILLRCCCPVLCLLLNASKLVKALTKDVAVPCRHCGLPVQHRVYRGQVRTSSFLHVNQTVLLAVCLSFVLSVFLSEFLSVLPSLLSSPAFLLSCLLAFLLSCFLACCPLSASAFFALSASAKPDITPTVLSQQLPKSASTQAKLPSVLLIGPTTT